MKWRIGILLGALLIAAGTGLARAEDDRRQLEDGEEPSAPRNEAPHADGFWPSQRMMELVVARWADEAAVNFKLNDEQRARLREQMENRWPTFMKENRARLQPMMNDFIEMRLQMEPPTREQVIEWTERALPVLQDIRKQFDEGMKEFRSILTPGQRAKFELESMKIGMGFTFAENKLRQWSRGEFTEREVWDPPASVRKARREREKAEKAEQEDQEPEAPPDPIEEELSAWEAFVAEFVRNYEFDDAQKTSAKSVLAELQERARAHRDRNRAEIVKLEAMIASGPASRETAAAETEDFQKQLASLYKPIDDMFSELKSRLEAQVTSQQRARAKERTDNPEPRRRRVEQRTGESKG